MKCALCPNIPYYLCQCSQIYVCIEHLGKHLEHVEDFDLHSIKKLTPLNEKETQSLKSEINRLIKVINEKKLIILRSTLKNKLFLEESAKLASEKFDKFLHQFIEIEKYKNIYAYQVEEIETKIVNFRQLENSIIPELEKKWFDFFTEKLKIDPANN